MYLRLFGNPLLKVGADEQPFAPERRYQLLVYLVCRDQWVPRDHLTALLWPEHANDAARRNLRRLLHDIRRLPWLAGFEIRGDALRWQVGSDLADFQRAAADGDWRNAVEAGAGPLLDGMEQGATEPFHEWLRFERETHLNRWRDCIARRRQEIAGDAAARAALSARVLAQDPYNESAMKDLVEALRLAGRGEEAERAYRDFALRLSADLGVEPTQQLRAVMPAPDSGVLQAAAAAAAPAQAIGGSTFIGRRLEQAELVALLTRPGCRQLTIHGPGGVGKSSLAQSALPRLAEAFPAGVHWIALQDIHDAAQIPARIANACGFKLALSREPLDSLAARIGANRMLLVFDNCEHLPGIGRLGQSLLARCAGLTLLHTSRARLGVAGEDVLALGGLPVPDDSEDEPEVLQSFDSIRLFAARACEVEPRFDLARNLAAVAALVRTLDGLPLALELAAACVRLLPVSEIARDLSRLMSLSSPAAAAEGPATRERSLRASFDHSWRLMTPPERVCLSQLAAFGGSFSLAAAHRVAGAESVMVASLVDKSLLGNVGAGRFSLHPLLRQFAFDHLSHADEVRQRHAAYFAQVLSAAVADRGRRPVAWVDADLADVIEAWRWATAQRALPLLQQMAVPLERLLSRYLRWQEGVDIFSATLKQLDGIAAPTDYLRATLLYGLARCRLYRGELDAAEEAARRSMRTFRSIHVPDVASGNLHTIGYSLGWRGEMTQARRFLEQSYKRALSDHDAESIAKARHGIAYLDAAAGHWTAARALYKQNELLCRDSGIHELLALSFNGLGIVCLVEKDWAGAIAQLDAGIAVCAAHEVNGASAFLRANRGLALVQLGKTEEARDSIDKAIALAEQWNIRIASVESHLARCHLAIVEADAALALDHLQRAVTIAAQIQSPLRVLSVVRYWGEWLLHRGERGRGLAVLEWVRGHGGALQKDRAAAAAAIAAQAPDTRTRNLVKSLAATLVLADLPGEILAAQPAPALRLASAAA